MAACPCGSEKEYSACCQRYIEGNEQAPTAEALMRSRYSAFVVHDVEYLNKTIDPQKRHEFDAEGIKKWSEESEWKGLEIVKTENGTEDDTTGEVEFIAKYEIEDEERAHHEIGHFRKSRGNWYFVDGEKVSAKPFIREEPKVGRNDPCPCGSGKKYKKCCAKSA
jgi:SEC-C motif-containing protein